jgi:hypothetical protein
MLSWHLNVIAPEGMLIWRLSLSLLHFEVTVYVCVVLFLAVHKDMFHQYLFVMHNN